ncbi:GIY-YIG nuclease family protein [Desulforamulus ruminis]|uniref:Excinuclease ABC C subunit domain protein n=1 Tax=Desulforamulus ruminis (strain ATCC 23193 / DSM 2154 / NCIMB 8452 / DL) TaxID=696281 RepID=F6DQE5_DESRL|nr:GIY-YIG nuclease family protein [Desulforamulus ruminis]AEG60839.1 Excinuclease ABC C subunit domain protein [Desulforamulus ruminis DSM 2154]
MEQNQLTEPLNYVVYILRCADQSLYTGITNNLEQRLKMHNLGKASKFTRGRLPVVLVYMEEGYTRGQALSREKKIKELPREQKLRLIVRQES